MDTLGEAATGILRYPRSIRSSANSLSGGVWCIVGSSICFSFTSVVVAKDKFPDGSPFPLVWISTVRGLVSLLFGILLWAFHGVNLLPLTGSKTAIALVRGACDFLASITFYTACRGMPVAIATLFLSTSMFITTILGGLFAGEKFEVVEGCLACVAFTGVVVSVFPAISTFFNWTEMDSSHISRNGCLHAVASCFFTSLNYLFGRLYTGETGSGLLQAVTAYGIAACILGSILSLGGSDLTKAVTSEAWDIHTVVQTSFAVSSALIGQVLMIRGMMFRHVTPSMTALMRALDVPFAMIWVFILLGVSASVYQMVGAVVVTCAACCLNYHKNMSIETLLDENQKRSG